MQPVRTLQISRRRRLRNGRYSGTLQQRQYGRLQNLHTAIAINGAVLEAAIQEERRAKLRWFFVALRSEWTNDGKSRRRR